MDFVFVVVFIIVVVVMLCESVRALRAKPWRDGWEWYATPEAKRKAYKRLKQRSQSRKER